MDKDVLKGIGRTDDSRSCTVLNDGSCKLDRHSKPVATMDIERYLVVGTFSTTAAGVEGTTSFFSIAVSLFATAFSISKLSTGFKEGCSVGTGALINYYYLFFTPWYHQSNGFPPFH